MGSRYVDAALAGLLVAVMATALVRKAPHEYLGAALFATAVAQTRKVRPETACRAVLSPARPFLSRSLPYPCTTRMRPNPASSAYSWLTAPPMSVCMYSMSASMSLPTTVALPAFCGTGMA